MYWNDFLSICYSALLGGLIGGAMCVFANRRHNKINRLIMEDYYWDADLTHLRSRIEDVEEKLSKLPTKTVLKAVDNWKRGKSNTVNWVRHEDEHIDN